MQLYRIVNLIFVLTLTNAYIPSDMSQHLSKVRPCVDFYAYACGGWYKENQLKDDETRLVLSTNTINTHIDHIIHEMIQRREPVITEYWELCNDIELITAQRNKPLQNDLNRIRETTTIDGLIKLAGEFARTGGNVFVKFQVGPNPLNTKQNTLLLQPQVTLPSSFYSDQSIMKMYEKYIYDLFKHADFKLTEPDISTKKRKRDSTNYTWISKLVIEIEQQLTHFQTQMDQLRFPITIENAIKTWPNVFRLYTSGMKLLKYDHDKRILTYNSYIKQDLMIWGSTEYLNHIETMLQTFTIKQLQIYIAFRMIHSRVEWLGFLFEAAWYQFFRVGIKGQLKHVQRQRICRDRLRKYFPDLIGQYFYTKSFDNERKGQVETMLNYIRVTMSEHITKAEWLNGNTDPYLESLRNILGESNNHETEWNDKSEKSKAFDKLAHLTTLIGQSNVRKSYPSTLIGGDYPSTMYNILSYSFEQDMKKIGQTRDRNEWTISSLEINAHYIPNQNAIVLPTALLQPPLFHGRNAHPARNFGALGSIIGHELIHAFDAKGSLYDVEGNEFPWWNAENVMYTKDAECFKKQYSAFEVDGRKVNGTSTLNENIADNGGVGVAYDAYRKYMTLVNPDTKGVTAQQGEQLFFLSFAQSLCERMRRRMISDNPQEFLPSKARVNGVVMNHKNFAAAFQCRSNNAMNPTEKCALW